MASREFLDLVKSRRSYYALKHESTIPNAKIQAIVEEALREVPSSFNSQSTRVIILFKEEHNKLWEITKSVLKGIVPAESHKATEDKLNGFKAGYGTVLFFEDRDVISSFQKNVPPYADKFPLWATQSDAMLQFAIWTGLEAEGLGANLQHYNPLIDAKVAAEWNVPTNWELNAQLVFGTPAADPYPKTFADIEGRFKVYGA